MSRFANTVLLRGGVRVRVRVTMIVRNRDRVNLHGVRIRAKVKS